MEKPREEFHSLNNNNDSRYLHKKFKKMATAVQPAVVQVEHGHSRSTALFENISNNQSTSHTLTSQDTPGRRLLLPTDTAEQISTPITLHMANSTKLTIRNSEAENNVQINHKDFSDNAIAMVRDSASNSINSDFVPNVIESKLFGVSDFREVCETNIKDSSNSTGNGRHVCPYCKLSCAKPSVLQKHIRAHTNERPYPCVPCGFAFKTKSNLYKHCRSRAHALRLQGTEETPNIDEDSSLGSEADSININNASRSDSTWSSDKTITLSETLAMNDNSADMLSSECVSPSNLGSSLVEPRPKTTLYKPKFHKASFYQEEDETPRSVLSPNPDFLNKHISKIISDNEAIVDTLDTPLHKKYSKDLSSQKQNFNDTLNSQDIHKNDSQPLNLTKSTESTDANHRKRCFSESFAQPESLKVPQHPLNPEGSIIKDLLLKARAQATGLLPVTSETYDASETLYICPLCQIPYRSADNLEIHRLYYCKGNSIPYSNSSFNGTIAHAKDVLKFTRPEHPYMRSNSVHVTLPETYNPNTLAKLASSTLKCPSGRSNKPENLVIVKSDQNEIAAPLPSPGPLLGNTRLVDTQSSSEGMRSSIFISDDVNSKITTPTLKRRQESHSSDNFCSLPKLSEESSQRSEMYSPPNKIRCTETPTTLRSLEELSLSPMRQNTTSLQMFGGEVKIVDNAGGTTTMRIEPSTSQHSPTLLSQSRASPKAQGPETSSIVVRSGLHSGGTIVHNPPTPKEPLPSPHPQTPRLLGSIVPNISTPNLTVTGIPPPNITKFQFPPIGAITAYNPLTLPPLSPASSPSGASTILHGGKLIPHVPGMPGPNSLSTYIPRMSAKMGQAIEALTSIPDSPLLREESNFNDKIKNNKGHSPEEDYSIKLQSPRLKSKMPNFQIFNQCIDKKENNKFVMSPTPKTLNSPSSKQTVPTIKINSEEVSPVNAKSFNIDFSAQLRQNIAQNKIDEILRKNTEILQKNSSKRSDSPVSKAAPLHNDMKKFTFNKVDKYSEDCLETKENKITKFGEKEIKPSFQAEVRQFNFENLISKSEILNKPLDVTTSLEVFNSNASSKSDDISNKIPERSETTYFKKNANYAVGCSKENQKQKFLRPTSLPLKPGTFTPKRHHGITPNANTLPLISPETPRPAKAYSQLYLNGHAYTYLGLKCSTKVYYCTLNRPQPTYVPKQHSLSMYSNWQVCSESTPHPLGLAPGRAMAHYDSRHRPQCTTVAKIKQDHLMTHSSQWSLTVSKEKGPANSGNDGMDDLKANADPLFIGGKKGLTGGFESNEEYTYVRGRGRGRYVCSECGIRCKKPSMLKKHIRTHTDVRPFTCKHCAFSFKTKGNLTKHMKSKAHYKKCCELGISPVEDGDIGDATSQGMPESDEDSDSDDDGNDGETESSDTDSWKSRLEHEAAHCLLSLWGGRPAPGLLSTARPSTYPYTPNITDSALITEDTNCKEDPTLQHGEIVQTVIRKQTIIQGMNFKQEKSPSVLRQNNLNYHPIDLSKPMDLSKGEQRDDDRVERISPWYPVSDILTPVGEPDFLASLVQSTAKLPQRTSDWHDNEPMLQAYRTEIALQDSRIKQSQYTNGRPRQLELNTVLSDSVNLKNMLPLENSVLTHGHNIKFNKLEQSAVIIQTPHRFDKAALSQLQSNESSGIQILVDIATSARPVTPPNVSGERSMSTNAETSTSTENAKFVASEYLKVACGKSNSESSDSHINNTTTNCESRVEKQNSESGAIMMSLDENGPSDKEAELQKINSEHIGVARKVVVGAGGVGFKLTTPSSDFSAVASFAKGHLTEDGRSVCVVCNKTFSKPSQLRLHINIHYMERPFRCSACAVSFRTRGHLQKHERSGSHHNKVSMTSTFGAATTTNPRPFKCSDCKIAFRIHGHLAKHLRSKMHVMRLECLGKLPFGTFTEIERAGVSLTDIDTTDCDNSLASLQLLAQKLHEKDPTKLEKWDPVTMAPPLLPPGADSSDDDEPGSPMAHHITSMDGELRMVNDSDSPDETNLKYSATDT